MVDSTGRDTQKSTSNLATDEELAILFNKNAYAYSKKLHKKFFSLYTHMTDDDVVMSCWVKVLSNNISWQPERVANLTAENFDYKFRAFVTMIVNSVCIDTSKYYTIRKSVMMDGMYSLDYLNECDSNQDNETHSIEGQFKNSMESVTDLLDTEISVANFLESNNISTRKGNTLKRCYDMTVQGVGGQMRTEDSGMLRLWKNSKVFLKDYLSGEQYSLEQILWDEELNYFETHSLSTFYKILDCRVTPLEDKVSLSSIVKCVLRNMSYGAISSKYMVSDAKVKTYFEGCLQKVF